MAGTKQKALVGKKLSALTAAEKLEMMQPLGINGLPYPARRLEEDAEGNLRRSVGIVQSNTDPLLIPTWMPMDRLNAEFHRNMPIPALMHLQEALIARTQPGSRNRLVAVQGEASTGKSHTITHYASVVHPDGAIRVDCGGMDAHELFWKPVVDYGKGVQEQFDKRLAQGRISKRTLKAIEQEFPGAVVRGEGEAPRMDWDKLGARKTDAEGKAAESYTQAARRANRLMKELYEREGISVQANAFGIKTVPGAIIESHDTGRPLFLDELNKAVDTSLDVFQSWLQFARGEIDEVTIPNPMATTSDDPDAPRSRTLHRDEIGAVWHVAVAGNDKSDGITTHEFSKSMKTRLRPIMYVREIGQEDWSHRISQIWTGLPLTTIYKMHKSRADADPKAFGEWLVKLRGLKDEKPVPPWQQEWLRNWKDTVQVAENVASYAHDRSQLAKEGSPMSMEEAYQAAADEIAEDGTGRIDISFRDIISWFDESLNAKPEVRGREEATLQLDLDSLFGSFDRSGLGHGRPGWHSFGANQARVILSDIENITTGMPQTAKALVTLAQEHAISVPEYREAKVSEKSVPMSRRMLHDSLADLGGEDVLRARREVMMSALRGIHPGLQVEDDNIVTLEGLGRAGKDMEPRMQAFEDENRKFEALAEDFRQRAKDNALRGDEPFLDAPRPSLIVVPNDDVDTVARAPLVAAQAVPSYAVVDAAGHQVIDAAREEKLLDFRSALAAMALPDYAEKNRAQVWVRDLPDKAGPAFLQDGDAEQQALTKASLDVLAGKSEFNVSFSIVAAKKGGETDFLYVLEDGERKKSLVVGPDSVSPDLEAALARNGVTYLVKSDEGTAERVDQFLQDSGELRESRRLKLAEATPAPATPEAAPAQEKTDPDFIKNITGTLVEAFGNVCAIDLPNENKGIPNDHVPQGTTLGALIRNNRGAPHVYTSLLKAG